MFYKSQNAENDFSHNSVPNLLQRTPFSQKNENNSSSHITRFSTNLTSITNNDTKKPPPPTAPKPLNHQKKSVSNYYS